MKARQTPAHDWDARLGTGGVEAAWKLANDAWLRGWQAGFVFGAVVAAIVALLLVLLL